MSDHRKLIIELPHLQTVSQRVGSFIVTVVCWLLWMYFLVPIVTLAGWLMGVRKFSQEIRWFGGYKSLLGLMELYGETVLTIALFWITWIIVRRFFRTTTHDHRPDAKMHQRDRAFFKGAGASDQAPGEQCLTVHFDDHAGITLIQPIEAKGAPR
jgi:poly-beta-1,6-N-acetyl-D-glucosamine biosynthesis protein PgaD